jgi:phage/plasmid-associated DNA primase
MREELKLNCVPIPLGSGKALTGKWLKWQDTVCNDKIDSKQDYAIMLGKSSRNVICLDFDHCNDESIVEKVFSDFKNKTLTVKTGNGYHMFLILDDLPKQATTYLEGKCKLEIKSHGSYVVGASSQHYDKVDGRYVLSGKNYDVISNVYVIAKSNITCDKLFEKLNELGFIKTSKPIEISAFDTFTLQTKKKGSNRQGEMLSIGVKMVMRNINEYNEEKAIELANKLNQKLKEPYNDEEQIKELGKSIWQYAKRNIKNNPIKFNDDKFDQVADLILKSENFHTIEENKDILHYDKSKNIWKYNGHIQIEKLCQDIFHKCKNYTVSEVVETIRRNTYIPLKTLTESKVISALDGVLNPKTFEITDHSPDYLTTTKLPFNLECKVKNEKLWNHILSIIEDKDINILMELIWIGISQNNAFKKCFFFKGLTNTQKTALVLIIAEIIGKDNVAFEKAKRILDPDSRFGINKLVGKRLNFAEEIGNMTSAMLETLKSLIGGAEQNTERKNDNANYMVNPKEMAFIFGTNDLGDILQRLDDDSIITRFQFLIFRNVIETKDVDGNWFDNLFDNEEDKQSAIDNVVSKVIDYKKAQANGKIPKTVWSNVEETRSILRKEMPKEEKWFEDERIISQEGSKIELLDIKKDFESFVGYSISTPQAMGNILKRRGFNTTQSNGKTILREYAFKTAKTDKCQNKIA